MSAAVDNRGPRLATGTVAGDDGGEGDDDGTRQKLSTKRKLLILAGVWIGGVIVLGIIYGFHGTRNTSFEPQNEFKLDNWVSLGAFSINKAVLYLVLAATLTCVSMIYIARRMQQRPNKVQAAVETLYQLMRENITGSAMEEKMAAKWFPFVGALFLFIMFSNLIGYIPLPTNTEHELSVFGTAHPVVLAVRGDRQHLDPARARARGVRLLHVRRRAREGPDRLPQRAWSRAASRAGWRSRSSSWRCSRT